MKMNRISALIIASLASVSSFADWEVNMPRGVSPTANAAYDLHMLIFYITVVIGVIVFLCLPKKPIMGLLVGVSAFSTTIFYNQYF